MKFPSMNVLTNHQSASTAEFARMITTPLLAIVGAVPLETTSLVLYPNVFFFQRYIITYAGFDIMGIQFLVIDSHTYPNFCPLVTKNINI